MEPRGKKANGQEHHCNVNACDGVNNIRTPLTVVSGHVQLLQRRIRRGQPLDKDDLLRSLGHIERAAQAIEAQLRDLSDERQ